jgi:hypothetical protein
VKAKWARTPADMKTTRYFEEQSIAKTASYREALVRRDSRQSLAARRARRWPHQALGRGQVDRRSRPALSSVVVLEDGESEP